MYALPLFDINRFRYLLLRQLRFSITMLLIGFGAVAGLIVFILSMQVIFAHTSPDPGSFFGLVMPFFFAGGYMFTSTMFSELRTPQRGYLYLILPASTLEKLMVAWFISSILYIAGALVTVLLINLLVMAVAVIFSSGAVPLFNLFEPSVLKMCAVYLVTQSVFLLGAIYFRRANFLKTLLSLFVIGMVISIYAWVAGQLIFLHGFGIIHFDNGMPENVQEFFLNTFIPVIKVLFWYCLAPFFLVVSYFRLKEREI